MVVPPEQQPTKGVGDASDQAGERPAEPTGAQRRLRELGDRVQQVAALSWILTFGLLLFVWTTLSGYRAEQWGGRGLWVFLTLCPAAASLVLGLLTLARSEDTRDPGVLVQGKVALVSGCLLIPVALLVLFWLFRV